MKKLIILIILAGLVTALSNSSEYIEIPSSSIRMRVIANSNNEKDQNEKMVIKSILEEKLYSIIESANSIEEVDELMINKKEEIDDYLAEKIKENNMNIEISSNYGLNYFPEKEYKGLIYKAGNYKSFVVTIGDGNGQNWWCVMFPPLCKIDENVTDYDYHYLIKDVIDKYN